MKSCLVTNIFPTRLSISSFLSILVCFLPQLIHFDNMLGACPWFYARMYLTAKCNNRRSSTLL